MITSRTQLLLFFALLLALVYTWVLRPSTGAPLRQVSEAPTVLSLESAVQAPDPLPRVDIPVEQQAPAAVEEKVPVQTVEERGDALVFECEALFGTPFDQAVVMPFD